MPDVIVCSLVEGAPTPGEGAVVGDFLYQIIDDDRHVLQDKLLKTPVALVAATEYNSTLSFFENMLILSENTISSCNMLQIEQHLPRQALLYQVFRKEFFQYGCQHYLRKCLVGCSICNRMYPCRHCHNQAEDHAFERSGLVQCAVCQQVQQEASACVACGVVFANYYCERCQMYDDFSRESKPIFHCDECGICRVGIKSYYSHCGACGNCIRKHYFQTHCCKNDGECPICLNPLNNSIYPKQDLPCHHQVHQHCLQLMALDNGYKCPLCRALIVDEQRKRLLFKQYEQSRRRTIPLVCKRLFVLVQCNECLARQVRRMRTYEFVCAECLGRDTHIIRMATRREFEQQLKQDPELDADLVYGSCVSLGIGICLVAFLIAAAVPGLRTALHFWGMVRK